MSFKSFLLTVLDTFVDVPFASNVVYRIPTLPEYSYLEPTLLKFPPSSFRVKSKATISRVIGFRFRRILSFCFPSAHICSLCESVIKRSLLLPAFLHGATGEMEAAINDSATLLIKRTTNQQ